MRRDEKEGVRKGIRDSLSERYGFANLQQTDSKPQLAYHREKIRRQLNVS